MAQENWWDNDPVANPTAQPAPRPGPVMGAPPSPTKQAAEARADAGAQNDQVRTGIAITAEGRAATKDERDKQDQSFKQAATLRGDFNGSKTVQNYYTAMPVIAASVGPGSSGVDDHTLVINYTKVMDPGSAAMSGEVDSAKRAPAYMDALAAKAQGEMSLNGGFLSDGTRNELKQAMIRRGRAYREGYDQERARYTADAQAYGVDPMRVVGQHFGETYRADMQAYDKERGIGRFANKKDGAPGGVTPPDGTPGPQNGQNGLRQYYENGVLVNEEDVVGTVDGNSSFFSSFFRMPRDANEVWEALKSGTGDLVQGGGDVLGIVGNPLNATINAVAGTNLSTDLGSSLREDLGFKPSDGDAVSAINRAAAGGLLTGGTAALGSKVGALPGMARNALAQYGATPVTDAVTAGTAAAAGEGARQAGAGPGGQFAATIAGGFTPAGAMGLARRVGSGPKVNALAAEVMGPFERSNVPMRQADFDPAARPQRAALEKSDKGRPIIQAADEADQAAMEARLTKIGGEGRVADSPYETGAMVQGALTRQGDRTKTAARARYERAEKLSGNPAIEPTQAIGATARHVADLQAGGANTNAAEIKFLTGLGEDLSAPGGKTISQLRDLRTNLRGRLKEQGLDHGQAEARALSIMDAASADIENGLKTNPRALEQYKAGDRIWRERADFRKNVTAQLIGKNGEKSAIDTASQVNILAKKDPVKMKRLMDEFEPEERADFVATIAANLGRNGKGEFSPAILLNNLDPRTGKISPQALRLVFGDDGVKAMKDLQVVAKSKIAARSDAAPSGASIQNMKRGLRQAIFAGMGFSTGGVGGAVAAPVVEGFFANLSDARKARLLTNPVFTKQLRNAPETTNPKAINTYFDRMTQSAAKSPVFAMDVEAFKQALAGAANKSTTAAAAGEQEQN